MSQSSRLRNQIRKSELPLAEIARRAGISVTTLHSFVSKEGAEMRASNFEKVARVVGSLEARPGAFRQGISEEAAGFGHSSSVTVEIGLPSDRATLLRNSGVDIAATARAGAEKALKEAEARAWADANREAIDAANAWIEKHGTLAEQLGLI